MNAITRLSPRPHLVVIGVEQEWSARSLETVLGPQGFVLERARSGKQTLELAATANPDVVLIDSRLSDIDGVEVCRQLREAGTLGAYVPVVLMTSGSAPREFVRDAYFAGAWSVWEQPLDGELLVLRLRTWITAKRSVDTIERSRLIDIRHGLYTHRGLQHRAREMIAEAARRQTPVACIAVGATTSDASGASYGRLLSSSAMNELGRAVAELARASDVVGQMGTCEFAILAPMTGTDGAETIVARLRDRVDKLPSYIENGEPVSILVRAGIATIEPPETGQSGNSDLLQRAATALRYAQSARRSEVLSLGDMPPTLV